MMKKDRYVEQPTKSVAEEEIGTFAKKVQESFHAYQVESTIPKLNVREAPSVDAEAIDSIALGQRVTIVGQEREWGKTKFSGWVNLKYTRRV